MKHSILVLLMLVFLSLSTLTSNVFASESQPFGYKTAFTGLTIPWEIEFGPDELLWVTERPGIFSRINLETGTKQVLLDIQDEVYTEQETGMLGFCFHPNFADTPWVFVSYVTGNHDHMVRVVNRFTFDGDSLVDPVRILTYDPAGKYHQGCRLFIDKDRMLWITMGDTPLSHLSQIDTSTVGKLLRMNLDGSAPADNPVPGQLFWSKGHRNIQGFVQLPNGNIWTSEHGNIIEDEVNFIVKGGNYGWPVIEGVADLPDEITYRDSVGARDPKWSTGETTFAPCGLQYYNYDKYPRLKNSLILAFLKQSRIMQFELNASGDSIVSIHNFLDRSIGRIRDIAIRKDGTIFLCTSNQEINGYPPFPLADDDRIVELVEYSEDCPTILEMPDTVRVSAVPGYPRHFSVPITSLSSCPVTVDYCWNMTDEQALTSYQWRYPFMLIPGQVYNTDAYFEPLADSSYHQIVQVGYDGGTKDTIILEGDTHIGVIATNQASLTIPLLPNRDTTFTLHFFNPGSAVTSITGVEVAHSDGGQLSLGAPSSDVVAPSDSMSFPVTFHAAPQGEYKFEISVLTDSYLNPTVSLTVVVSEVGAVKEGTNFVKLVAMPNPSAGHVTAVLPDFLIGGSVTISNSIGEIVWTGITHASIVEWNGLTTDGAGVPAGAYSISIQRGNLVGSCMVVLHTP